MICEHCGNRYADFQISDYYEGKEGIIPIRKGAYERRMAKYRSDIVSGSCGCKEADEKQIEEYRAGKLSQPRRRPKMIFPAEMEGLVTIHSNDKQFYFSSKMSQRPLEGFLDATYTLPHRISPRPEFPDGLLETPDDLVKLYYKDKVEIPNPDPNCIPDYRKAPYS